MLRWLAILAVLLTCLPVYGQEKTPKSNRDQSNSKTVKQQSPDPSSVCIVNSVDNPTSQGKGNDSENHSDTYLHHLLFPETLASIGLLIVGIVGTCIALHTLTNIERQTKTGEIAANAAFSNAHAVVLSERARLVAKVVELDPRRFHIQGWNVGRVPARVTLINGWHLLLPYGDKLPPIPHYVSQPPHNRDYIEWVPSKEFIDVMPDDDNYRLVADLGADDLYADIMNKKRVLWVYGRICYEDGIFSEIRETRFCYETVLDERMELDLVMSGPAIYRLET